ncbi:MAG: prepilin-type N-terminal cleavage/methylation domain-containing protein [Candidatus Delongbacteria bacterium]|nr:prepilin-type N-terminal cleavage/methylation domain-containing protein [Candidatus Delongbacteria bacterium]
MNKKGFTLLEVLITATIFAIMGIGIMYFIAQSNTIMNKSVNQTFAHTNATRILNMLTRDIHEGVYITLGNNQASDRVFSIVGTDSSVVKWGTNGESTENGYRMRITRNDIEIPFIGANAENINSIVYLFVQPHLDGNYVYANIDFKLPLGSAEEVSISTVAYCRHDPYGYGFNPAEFSYQ